MTLLIVILVGCLINRADAANLCDIVVDLHHPVHDLAVTPRILANQIRLSAARALELIAIDEIRRVECILRHAKHLFLPFRIEMAKLAAVAVEILFCLRVDHDADSALFTSHAEAGRAGVVRADDDHVRAVFARNFAFGNLRRFANPAAAHAVINGISLGIHLLGRIALRCRRGNIGHALRLRNTLSRRFLHAIGSDGRAGYGIHIGTLLVKHGLCQLVRSSSDDLLRFPGDVHHNIGN